MPFSSLLDITSEGRISTQSFMAEYNQDRFELDVMVTEIAEPRRSAITQVTVKIKIYQILLQYIFATVLMYDIF